MRITKIVISNYRQHKNINIDFTKHGDHDLHLFIAKNGVGKTNTLNALYWCLYNEEPYLSIKNEGLPLLNKNCWNSGKQYETVSVEIHLQNLQNSQFKTIIKRTQKFDLIPTSPMSDKIHLPSPHPSKLSIRQSYGGANPKEITDPEETEHFISRFVPKGISEYFLFDGERLDSYFKGASGENIGDAIVKISKLDLLDRMIERLSTLQNEYLKEMGTKNISVNELATKCHNLDERIKAIQVSKSIDEEEVKKHNARLAELEKELQNTPDIKMVENNLQKSLQKIDHYNKELEIQKKKKRDILYTYFIRSQFYQPMIDLKKEIDQKRSNKEIPVIQNKDVIEEIKKSHHCSICGRDLDSHAEECINELLKSFTLSTTVSSELIGIDSLLGNSIREFVENFPSAINDVTSHVQHYDEQLVEAENEKETYSSTLKNYGDGKIRAFQEERESREDAKANRLRSIGSAEQELTELNKELNKANRELKSATDKVDKTEKSRQFSDICRDAIQILEQSRVNILTDIRSDIESEANKAFFRLIWKKSSFEKIQIKNNYSLMLFDNNGIPALGSVSQAENELLALAFTIALHKVSGFEAPIILDTPVARITSEQREAFGRALVDVSKEKQLILLFTPDEYTENIRRVIEPIASQKYIYELSEDETETNLIAVGSV